MRAAVVAHFIDDKFIVKLDRDKYNVCYKSKRFNYVYLYFNKSNKESVMQELKNISDITVIEDSLFEIENLM